jgi:hypothetical protein
MRLCNTNFLRGGVCSMPNPQPGGPGFYFKLFGGTHTNSRQRETDIQTDRQNVGLKSLSSFLRYRLKTVLRSLTWTVVISITHVTL